MKPNRRPTRDTFGELLALWAERWPPRPKASLRNPPSGMGAWFRLYREAPEPWAEDAHAVIFGWVLAPSWFVARLCRPLASEALGVAVEVGALVEARPEAPPGPGLCLRYLGQDEGNRPLFEPWPKPKKARMPPPPAKRRPSGLFPDL